MSVAILLFGTVLAVLAVVFYFVFASFVWGAGYQPTPRRSVEAMLRLAEVGPDDVVFDLGAGTGAVLFRAAARGARAVGVEVEPVRILILRLRRWLFRSPERVEVVWGNLFALDFRRATVVAVFLWPGAMARLRPIFDAQLRPGARIVSHYHLLPRAVPDAIDREARVYLYRWPPTADTDSVRADGSGTRAQTP